MTTLTDVVLRDAGPDDHHAAAHILTTAFHGGLRWAEPDPAARTALLAPYFAAVIRHAARHGTIRLAEVSSGIPAVAVWFPHPPPPGVIDVHDVIDPSNVRVTPAAMRLGVLEKTLQDLHPITPHEYLAYLGVVPARQNRGLGTHLLTDQLHTLRRDGTSAYLEANNPDNERFYRQHGFRRHGPDITIAGCPPVTPMWWSPDDDAR